MPLTHAQRLDRLTVRLQELEFWRARDRRDITGWTFEGQPIALGEGWPRVDGPVHFAAHADIPADWDLEDTRAYIDLGGESLVTFTAADGAAKSHGNDPYHREFSVFARSFDIASESVPRAPFGVPVKEPRLERTEIFWLDRPVDDLWLLLRQIDETVRTIIDHEAVPHLLALSEEAFSRLDWPSETQNYIARISPWTQQQKIWKLPEMKEHPAGLSDAERQSVADTYDWLMGELKALRERFPPQGKVSLTGHAHIDLAWLWPYAETRRKNRRSFHTTLRLMEKFPDFRFNQTTAHYYQQLEKDDSELLADIVSKVKSGQWDVLGGMWVEPDTNMPTGESLARQILYGQRYFERVFGFRHDVCWLPDCFGFSPALPQLLKQGGMDNFLTIKVNWSETNRFPTDLFWWEGLDGSRVLTHTFDNPVEGYNGVVRPDSVINTWRNYRQKDTHDTTLLSVGYGDGGGGVTAEMIRREQQLQVFPVLPETKWELVTDFFARVHETVPAKSLNVWRGEIYLELHRGTLTSQSIVKRLHRRAERDLITAETLESLDYLTGGDYPVSLEENWQVVLKNEFHDILPGSSIKEVYEDAAEELTGVIDAARSRREARLKAIAARLPDGGEGVLLAVNPSLSPMPLRFAGESGWISSGSVLPPLSVNVLSEADLAPAGAVSADPRHLENDILKVTFGDDGNIASLVHKPSGRETLAGPGNRLIAYPMDKPRSWDAWDIEADYDAKSEPLDTPDEIALVETGPHRAAIRITRTWRHSRIVQTLSLSAGSPRLDIHTEVDWHDRRALLRTETPLAIHHGKAIGECAFGVIERATHANTTWQQTAFEFAAHRFVDLAENGFGFALLNDAKYGYSARGNVLGLSLLRSPIYPDPLADEGHQAFTYALMPHEGNWHEAGVLTEAELLNQPPLTLAVSGKVAGVQIPLKVSGVPAALGGLKLKEDSSSDLVLRVYEPAGRRGPIGVETPQGFALSDAVTLMEEPSGAAADQLMPFEVKSWVIGKG
ncbi:alpha-mannosidase [Martelella endophytica]|uniref:Alpha-mannosidase n=1 Tax=Martelella endophytica TaxID=1486262 RepID=A0A0D5LQL0_MAREN|nr:glycoside hydrolase family 38 C-terminal domain-containing protein [Martelella endophytica]AJY46052.1 alpha-mannosidase [Martelella endophytica]